MKKIDFRKREDLVEEITQIEASLFSIYKNIFNYLFFFLDLVF